MNQINLMKRKLIFFKEQLQNGNTTRFPSLRVTDENAKFFKKEMKAFAQNLHHVYEEMENRFSEFTDLSVSEKLLRNLFDIETNDFRQKEDKEELNFNWNYCDFNVARICGAKPPKGMNYSTSLLQFWQELYHEQFPYLKKEANRIISMFSTTYMCEQPFSVMKQIKSASRNRFLNPSLKNLLVATTTNFLPDFLANECKQFHTSH